MKLYLEEKAKEQHTVEYFKKWLFNKYKNSGSHTYAFDFFSAESIYLTLHQNKLKDGENIKEVYTQKNISSSFDLTWETPEKISEELK